MSYTLDGFTSCIPEAILKTKVYTIDGAMTLRETLDSSLHESEIIYDAKWVVKDDDAGPYLDYFHAISNLSYISLINTPYGKILFKHGRK